MGTYIYGWFDREPIVNGTIGPTNFARIGFDTILESEFLRLTQPHKIAFKVRFTPTYILYFGHISS